MSRCLRFTMKVVEMTAAADAPDEIMATAMNWDPPAKTVTDITAICQGAKPAFWARTPRERPMGK